MIDDMNDESSNKSKFAGLCFDKLWTFNELFKGCSPLTRWIESRTILFFGCINDSAGYFFVGL